MLKILLAIVALAMAASLAPAAFADTSLTLDPIPASAYAGDTVTFTGVLYADGSPLAGKVVYIQEDDFGPDEVLAHGWTDQNGRFAINWRAVAGTIETEFEIYAIFEGDSRHEKDRTRNQEMDVFERRGTQVILNRIPDRVYAGDTVTFTGTLYHRDQPLAGKKVYIQDEDELRLDDYLKSGTTDRYGRFSITWTAKVDPLEAEREIRAVFEGDSSFGRDTSRIQDMYVTKIGGDIKLDRFPRTAKVGQAVTFSGTLSFDRGSPAGAVVYIKDEDTLSRDELLATGYVESNGRFSATWIAEHRDFDDTVDIFAVFEGDGRYGRQATCSRLCGDTMPLLISGRVDPSPPAPPPPAPGGGPSVPDGARYMEMYYALNLRGPPHVVIVPDPDAYGKVSSHIVPAQEGINTWVHALKDAYGRGNWDVTYEVVPQGKAFYESRPDVVVNLVTTERADGCNDYYGWANIFSNPSKPVQTVVCSESEGKKRSNHEVARTAGHEFIHAMGLGHAFNKPGDVMCSVEDNVETCRPWKTRTAVPSSLNLAAVTSIYGTDGFPNPNNRVEYKSRLAEGGPAGAPPSAPPIPPPPAATQPFPNDCTTDDRRYNINLQNYELNPGRYAWYTICNTGTVEYSFSTADRDAGFALYVLPPETDVGSFVNDGEGNYYTCEDPDDGWYSRSNECNVDVGSRIVLHNDYDIPITINGRITTDVAQQPFPNDCTTDDRRYNINLQNYELNPGRYAWYTICNTGTVEYSFSTADRDAGFALYVLPPETDVGSFVNDGEGNYYTCEDPDDGWYSRSNECNVDVGSRIVLHNDYDIPITINGRITTDVAQQPFPNDCTTDDRRYNINLQNYELNPGRYAWYTICNTGTVEYSFSTADRDAGFALYVLPPETDVGSFVNDGEGNYYTCEDPDDGWYSRSNECNVDVGSRIVLHNDYDIPITINGRIRT